MKSMKGVSLIEALVALAVMAFGMLGVVAMQTTMRQNADVSKQRSEAVRLAHEAIESRRGFTVLAVTAGKLAYADLVTLAAETVPGVTSNATFTRTVTIPDLGSGRTKTLLVDVSWADRTGALQSVRLSTAITGSVPELAATLGLPPLNGSRHFQPDKRHSAIPPAAVDQGDGSSNFTPPGASAYWVFNNATGFIEKTCTSPTTCVTVNLRLLAGYVNFATGLVQPLPADAENPTSTAFNLDVAVAQTFPSATTISCFKDLQATSIAYYCAIPVDLATGLEWSGTSYLTGGSLSLASAVADATSTRHRVCRYTPVRDCQPAMPTDENAAFALQDGTTVWGAAGSTLSCTGADPTPKRKLFNAEHPLNYVNVTQSMGNQNFLVIRAGDGTTAFTCPPDDTGTPLIQGNTWDHQPSS